MNRILIIGATGYIGKYMAKASVSLGYPTFAFVRPSTAAPHSSKSQLLQQFRDDGIVILQVSDSNLTMIFILVLILCPLTRRIHCQNHSTAVNMI